MMVRPLMRITIIKFAVKNRNIISFIYLDMPMLKFWAEHPKYLQIALPSGFAEYDNLSW